MTAEQPTRRVQIRGSADAPADTALRVTLSLVDLLNPDVAPADHTVALDEHLVITHLRAFVFSILVERLELFFDNDDPADGEAITGVSTGDATITIAGNREDEFRNSRSFDIANSTGNDGTYVSWGAVYDADDEETTITVDAVPDATVDGDVTTTPAALPGAISFETFTYLRSPWIPMRLVGALGHGLWAKTDTFSGESTRVVMTAELHRLSAARMAVAALNPPPVPTEPPAPEIDPPFEDDFSPSSPAKAWAHGDKVSQAAGTPWDEYSNSGGSFPVLRQDGAAVWVIDDFREDAVVILRLDESSGTNAPDTSGNANDGTLTDGAAFEALSGTEGDNSSHAVRFDGTNDYIDLGTPDVSGSGITVACWFNADTFPGASRDPRLVSKADGDDADDHIWMLSTINSGAENTRLRCRVRVGGTTTTLATTTPAANLSTGTWYHGAFTYDGTTVRIYTDGVELNTTALTGSVDTDATMDAVVGAQPPGLGARFWDGLIDDVRIYERALTPEELTTLAQGTKPSSVAKLVNTADRALFPTSPPTLGDDYDVYLRISAYTVGTGQPVLGFPDLSSLAAQMDHIGATICFRGTNNFDEYLFWALNTAWDLGGGATPSAHNLWRREFSSNNLVVSIAGTIAGNTIFPASAFPADWIEEKLSIRGDVMERRFKLSTQGSYTLATTATRSELSANKIVGIYHETASRGLAISRFEVEPL